MEMRYQPQGLLRVARTPLTAGLRLAVLPGVNRAYDAVSARLPILSGTKQGSLGPNAFAGFYSTYGVATTDSIATGVTGPFPATGRSYFFRARRNGSGGGSLGRLYDNTNGASLGTFLCWENSATRLRYGFFGAGAERTVAIPNSAITAAVGEWFEILFTHGIDSQGNNVFNAWVNGEQVVFNLTSTNVLNDNPTAELVIGNRSSGTRGWDGLIECAYVWDRTLTAADAAALRQNRYQVYDDLGEGDELMAAAPAGVALSGTALVSATAAGALSTSVRLTGAAYVAATASAGLSSSIRLAGAAQASASGAAALSSGIRLAGSVAVQSSASGQLQGAAVALSGGAYVQASAVGVLSSAIRFVGAAASQVTVTGSLSFASAPVESVDISQVSPARIVVFEGSGSRRVPFEGSGSRVTPFDSSGSRVVVFEGSGSRTVRF